MDTVDNTIVGAGVVGLAIASRLSQVGQSSLILDQAPRFGDQTSSRNSEVIHAGIYYPSQSLKALLCVEGKRLLYRYCKQRQIHHRAIGKLIVACDPAEIAALQQLQRQARQNGVHDLRWLERAEIAEREPQLHAIKALWSPSTGILDSHALMQSLLTEAIERGSELVLNTEVTQATPTTSGFVITTADGYRFCSRQLINAAGLGAQCLAHNTIGLQPQDIPELYPCKGHYYTLSGPSPFAHLIYPVPNPNLAGLGVHATIDLAGQVKFGPDTLYLEQPDYRMPEQPPHDYYQAIQRYYPNLQVGQLQPGYAGVRPKLQGPGDKPADFAIQGPKQHGIDGLVQLFGIESPGLTACLAIAEYVKTLLR